MAPVACGISYGKKDGAVFLFRFLKGFLAPWIPVHRIKGMLQQIGIFFVDQAVGSQLENLLTVVYGLGSHTNAFLGSI